MYHGITKRLRLIILSMVRFTLAYLRFQLIVGVKQVVQCLFVKAQYDGNHFTN